LSAQLSRSASLAYNSSQVLRLAGPLDHGTLTRCLQQLLDRHEMLRSHFDPVEPLQHIEPRSILELPFTDLLAYSAESRNSTLERLVAEQAATPFDLTRAPLLRTSLVRIGETEHALILTLSQLVADPHSLTLLIDELRHLLAKAAGSSTSGLLPPAPFSEYRAQPESPAQQAAIAKSETYWRNRFASRPSDLELPSDRVRPARRSQLCARESLRWAPALRSKLQNLASTTRSTLPDLLLSATTAWLHRLSNQDDIVIGLPVADRPTDRVLVGPCSPLLPLRSTLPSGCSFAELLSTLQTARCAALEHRHTSFGRLLQLLAIARDPARSPLVQATFAYDSAPRSFTAGNLSIRIEPTPPAANLFDLSLTFSDDGHELTVHCDYNTDLYDETTIARWLGHLHTLLTHAASAPSSRIDDLPLLTPGEIKTIVHDWNATHIPYPADLCLHHLIEAQARRTPDAPAVTFGTETLSYAQLDARANQLAHHLQKRGVSTNHLVGISLERSLELVIGLIAILKAGAAYVPIDPGYPQNRIAYLLSDSAVTLLLTQQNVLKRLPPHHATPLCLDSDWDKVATEPASKPAELAHPDSLAYMIYTSGSTGEPKGALNSHRGIVNRLLWFQDTYKLTPTDSVMQKTPFSFDVSVWEFFQPLIAGARLVVAAPGGHQDPAYLIRLIREQALTVVHFVPSMLRIFLDEPDVESCTTMRLVVCSGEALPYEVQELFQSRHPALLENLYGPTETAVEVTWWSCPRNADRKIVPIGRPVANTTTYILDPYLKPVPIGLPGELHLGGVQVGLGYHNRPELTAKSFIPDPFANQPNARLYKTGDLCRYLPDGNIEYLGRIDHQVKIHGLRIELGEIENAISQHPGVKETVVVARTEPSGDKRLVAYLVLGTPAPDTPALREHLKACLPEYMVPSAFVFLQKLPLNSNGKIDRKALPAPPQDRRELAEYLAPRNETETRLAAIWAEALHIPRIGVLDNFFALGGNSLLALKLNSRVRQQFELEVPLSVVFETPTIAAMATKLQELRISSMDEAELAAMLDEIEAGLGSSPTTT
jgi:amino acid adenylation domain-containing protein